jgi:UDPglucose 6-dehydrogenase
MISIIGTGMVGGALEKCLKDKPFVYDKGQNRGSVEEINKGEVIFICVPTPYKDGGFDLSYVEESCEVLKGDKIVVIKSTVLPGTTEYLQKKYPQHLFLFNPEFLVESNALETMKNPDRQIVGYTDKSKAVADYIMDILPDAPYKKTMPATEAEMVKYFGNNFLSVKVIFGNQMYDLCEKTGINYDTVMEAASKDPRIGPSHLEIFHAGHRGYGGKCLVKDTRALIEYAHKNNIDLGLIEKAEEINNKLIKEQGIDDPEKYSERNPY